MSDTQTTGSNGRGPHGLARFGDEWRAVEPVDGTLTIPPNADEFVLTGGAGGALGGTSKPLTEGVGGSNP